LYQRFYRKYDVLYPQVVVRRDPIILCDSEMDDLVQLQEWLYRESLYRLEQGITHPSLDDI
jgi:hypothetical protein